jgi:hypothetical protein
LTRGGDLADRRPYVPEVVRVDLLDEALRRLDAEAARRGVSIDAVINDLAMDLPATGESRRRPAFVAVGARHHRSPRRDRR